MTPLETLKVRNCARCGGFHENLPLKKFTKSIDIADNVIDQWAVCPTTNEPILVWDSVRMDGPALMKAANTTLLNLRDLSHQGSKEEMKLTKALDAVNSEG